MNSSLKNSFNMTSINTQNESTSIVSGTKKLFNSRLPFPLKLHALLDEIANQPGHEDIISWQPHGRAFRIHHPKKFEKSIMSRYFNNTKYKSFQRQLHLYDFYRLKTGVDAGAYYHKLFIRGQPSLSLGMDRRKVKGIDGMTRSDSQHDIAFYAHLKKLKENNELKVSKGIDSSVYRSRKLYPINTALCHESNATFLINPTVHCVPQNIPFIGLLKSQVVLPDKEIQSSSARNEKAAFGTTNTEKEGYEAFRLFESLEHGQEMFEGRKFFFVDDQCLLHSN